jgi:hypothetical protein
VNVESKDIDVRPLRAIRPTGIMETPKATRSVGVVVKAKAKAKTKTRSRYIKAAEPPGAEPKIVETIEATALTMDVVEAVEAVEIIANVWITEPYHSSSCFITVQLRDFDKNFFPPSPS